MAVATALTIAGSDSGGGAGIQADLKTFSALGVYGTCAITALTAQNTQGVQGVYEVAPEFVAEQIKSVATDIQISACKTGMLANQAIVKQVVQAIDEFHLQPLVVDPVMVAQSGDSLLTQDAVASIKEELIAHATIITPNLPEAAVLLDSSVEEILKDPQQAVATLLSLGPQAVLLKGGHAVDHQSDNKLPVMIDYLAIKQEGQMRHESFEKQIINTHNTHGSGCTLAAAITAHLAQGLELLGAVKQANKFIDDAIRYADNLGLGTGSKSNGPVHHLYKWWL